MRFEDEEIQTWIEAPTAVKPPSRAFSMVVISGPDKGASFSLQGGESVRRFIGQSEVCHIRLTDREVSRRHAAIEQVDNVLRLTDLDSSNGTRVDRVRVVEALLSGGEIIRVGSTQLRVDDVNMAEPDVATEASSRAGDGPVSWGRVMGQSEAVTRLHLVFSRLAQSAVPVIIEGETGTGKEVLAESLHEMSPRAQKPFVVFDCTAVPPSLVESELFGHERGAFTGATALRRGVFEQAHGGTLFIDEIGDLELSLQPKLLRAIERSEVRRLGGEKWISVDVRIVAATRRNLDREVEAQRFRDDLFHRLSIARIELPPLRHRKGDIGFLARHFWSALGAADSLPDELLKRLESAPWPGNVRALRNAIASYLAMGELPVKATSLISAHSLGDLTFDQIVASGEPFPLARDKALQLFTDRYVAHVLESHHGDVAAAVKASGISRRYFGKLRAGK